MLGATELQCHQAFAAGDMAFYNASGCAASTANDQLIAQKKSEIGMKTYVLIGVGVVATGLIIYFSTRKSKAS
ncbi:MAG TPA: hypothetical protein VK589_30105 [Chryseolinea sp.]|nr:hypothetical protein [Chryseolinea sp.]